MEKEKKERKKSTLKKFYPYMGKRKFLIPLSLLVSVISAVLQIVPFILVWYVVRTILLDQGNEALRDAKFYAMSGFIAAVAAILTYFLALMLSHLAAFRVEIGLQKVGMKKIMSKPLGFFDQNSTGKMRKTVSEGAAIPHAFLAHQLPDLAGTIISPIILIILLAVVDWRMGTALLIPVILGFITMKFMTSSEGKDFEMKYFDSLEEMSAESVEYVRGIPVVKTFGQTVYSFKRFYNSIIRYKEMVYAYTCLWKRPMSVYSVLMQSAAFFLVPAAVIIIGRGENLAVVLSDFIFYLLISPVFGTIIMKSMYFQRYMGMAGQAVDRIETLLEYPDMEYEREDDMGIDKISLEFKDVVFSYPGSENNAVDGISFKINEGETVALVGVSGSGKTTIARLAARFWDVKSGEVLLGGININKLSKRELMDNISFVFQNTRLFKGTIKENIMFGSDSVSENDLENAIETAQAKDIIAHLENGLNTVIGSKGTYLSGGEQQRIALARAIVKNSPVVLLDEATAFTDPENEHLIQKALKELSRGKTTLIIAHRLTTVQDADKILVINKGKIAEAGRHEDLLNKGGMYKKMWDEYQRSIEWKLSSRYSKKGVV